MLLQRLFKFTNRDREFQSRLSDLTTKREELSQKTDTLFQAALDHEGEWFLLIAKKQPECVIKAIADCVNGRDRAN